MNKNVLLVFLMLTLMVCLASCQCKNVYIIRATHDISMVVCLGDYPAKNIISTLDTFLSEEYCLVKDDSKTLIRTIYNPHTDYNDTPCQHFPLKEIDKESRDFYKSFLARSYGGNVSVTDTEAQINGQDYYIFHIKGDSTNLILLSVCKGNATLEIELWEPLNTMRIVNSIKIRDIQKQD